MGKDWEGQISPGPRLHPCVAQRATGVSTRAHGNPQAVGTSCPSLPCCSSLAGAATLHARWALDDAATIQADARPRLNVRARAWRPSPFMIGLGGEAPPPMFL